MCLETVRDLVSELDGQRDDKQRHQHRHCDTGHTRRSGVDHRHEEHHNTGQDVSRYHVIETDVLE